MNMRPCSLAKASPSSFFTSLLDSRSLQAHTTGDQKLPSTVLELHQASHVFMEQDYVLVSAVFAIRQPQTVVNQLC